MAPPMASNMDPITQHSREPQRSRIVPTGKADTLAVMEAIVKKRLSLVLVSDNNNLVTAGMRMTLPEILLRTQFKTFVYFGWCTALVINALLDEDWFQSGEPKHDTRREPAREHGHHNLRWGLLAGIFAVY